jgi:hypothetical protein
MMSSELDSWFCDLNEHLVICDQRVRMAYLSVQLIKETSGPAVAVEPIEASPLRVPLIGTTGVCNIANKVVDVGLVRS